jgi:hypothetical protein
MANYVLSMGNVARSMEATMAKYEFELPTEYEVSVQKGAATAKVNVDKLSHEVIGKLVLHGLRQKIADAAAGAKKASEADDETRTVAEIASDLMAKVVTNLETGNWGVERSGGVTADPLDKYRIEIMREVMRVNPKVKKAYDAIDSDDQTARREFLLKIAAKNAGTVDPEAERRMEVARAAKKAAAGLDLDI